MIQPDYVNALVHLIVKCQILKPSPCYWYKITKAASTAIIFHYWSEHRSYG